MSGFLSQELQARGVAQVIVVLRAPGVAPFRAAAGTLARHFVHSDRSQTRALARELGQPGPAYRVFPNLGVVLGTVDRGGLAACLANSGPQQFEGGGNARRHSWPTAYEVPHTATYAIF
jgi:hypothetical protein